MFAGMMILYTKEFKMGDVIEVQSDQTYFGRIEEITIRYTVIRTLDLRQVVIPNMTMISKPIKTFSSENIVKLNTTVGIHYKSDVSKAIMVIKDAINSFNFVQNKDNTVVFVTNF
jgi:small conductance mechanosensitive channel